MGMVYAMFWAANGRQWQQCQQWQEGLQKVMVAMAGGRRER